MKWKTFIYYILLCVLQIWNKTRLKHFEKVLPWIGEQQRCPNVQDLIAFAPHQIIQSNLAFLWCCSDVRCVLVLHNISRSLPQIERALQWAAQTIHTLATKWTWDRVCECIQHVRVAHSIYARYASTLLSPKLGTSNKKRCHIGPDTLDLGRPTPIGPFCHLDMCQLGEGCPFSPKYVEPISITVKMKNETCSLER